MVERLRTLSVEPPKGSSPLPFGRAPKGPLLSLLVEHLKVMAALSVEPAYASLTVEPASLMLIGWGYGRAPPDLNSRACFRILDSRVC